MRKLLSRRSFLYAILGSSALAWIASVLYPVFRFLLPPPGKEAGVTTVKATTTLDLAPNTGKIFKFGTKPALCIRKPDGDFVAYLAKCTHLDCIVQYRSDKERIWCACHNGYYDLNGANVSGPPPRPLDELDVHIKGDDVFVTRKA